MSLLKTQQGKSHDMGFSLALLSLLLLAYICRISLNPEMLTTRILSSLVTSLKHQHLLCMSRLHAGSNNNGEISALSTIRFIETPPPNL